MKATILRAVLGGIVGTVVMTLMMYFAAPHMMGKPMDIAHLLADVVGAPWILGMLAHFGLGVVAFPLAYVLFLIDYLPGPPAVRGILWGLMLWVVAMVVVMPILGQGFFMSQGAGLKGVVASLMVHIVYGALLGAITGRPARAQMAGAPAIS